MAAACAGAALAGPGAAATAASGDAALAAAGAGALRRSPVRSPKAEPTKQTTTNKRIMLLLFQNKFVAVATPSGGFSGYTD